MNTKWEEEYDRHYKGGGKKIITHKMRKDFIKDQITKAQQEIAEQIIDNLSDISFYDLDHDIREYAMENKTERQQAIETLWETIHKHIQDQLRKKYLNN